MSNKRLNAILSAVILLIAGAFTIRAGTAPAPVAPIQVKAADPAARLPSGEIPPARVEANDYFERHSEVLRPGNMPDYSDYIERHPELLKYSSSCSSGKSFEKNASRAN